MNEDLSLIELNLLSTDVNLLYVEDNEETRERILDLLNTFSFNIISAVDGEDGLLKYKENKIDFIISDIEMPNMDGFEMLKIIREKDADIPIVIFSAYDDNEKLKQAIDLGVDNFLPKPIEFDKYIVVLKKVLKNISVKKELELYKHNLEEKVQEQLQELLKKDAIIQKQAKLAAMGEMIDIIAHQWKQPLNIISLRSDYLCELYENQMNVPYSEVRNCHTKAREQIDHLINTVNEFRSFFRPEVRCEIISVKTLIESISILLKDYLVQNQIHLITQFDEKIEFSTNLNEIKHIFINLIHNARDAFVENKTEDRQITILSEEDEYSIVISVEDNAGGIPESILTHIFELNFTTKGHAGGTGVGLYMCKMIAQKYDYKLEVCTIKNKTKFVLTIPKK